MLSEGFGLSFLALDFPFPCEIHFRAPRRLEANDNFKVLVLFSEPAALCIDDEALAQMHGFFDLIVTNRAEHLVYPNAVRQFFGGTWVSELPTAKEFSVSSILSFGGNVRQLPGYDQRRELVENSSRVTVPLRLYRSRKLPDSFTDLPFLEEDRKECLFRSMFHVAIENAREPSYFSEKLIDCLLTYTVPLYYGCTAISEFFDPRGIIQFADADELVSKLNLLTADDYWSRLEAMQENFTRAQRYINWTGRLRRAILLRHAESGTKG